MIAPDTQGIAFPDTEIVTNCRIVVKGLCGTHSPIENKTILIGEYHDRNRKREDMGMCEFCELYTISKEIAKEKKLNHGINSTFKAVLR